MESTYQTLVDHQDPCQEHHDLHKRDQSMKVDCCNPLDTKAVLEKLVRYLGQLACEDMSL